MGRVNVRVLSLLSILAFNCLNISGAYAANSQTKTSSKAKKSKSSKIKHKHHSTDYMEGVASCYAPKFVGRRTTSGDKFVMDKFTGASPTLPMRTKLKVTNLKNYKVVYIEVNDRMALSSGHVIDLPIASGSWIGLNCPVGMTKVKLEIVDNATYHDALQAQLAGIKMYDSLSNDNEYKNAVNRLNESDYSMKYDEITYESQPRLNKESASN